MNRKQAIARARELIRKHSARVNNAPVIDVDDDGNFCVKMGCGGLLIRMAARSGSEDSPNPDQAAG